VAEHDLCILPKHDILVLIPPFTRVGRGNILSWMFIHRGEYGAMTSLSAFDHQISDQRR
jgi:hypothetical protein